MPMNDLGAQPNVHLCRAGRMDARRSNSEVDMATVRPSEIDQMNKKSAIKLPRTRGRPATRPTDAEEGHIGAMENQMVPTLPPLPDDDEPKQG
jgi:hypothetical protein